MAKCLFALQEGRPIPPASRWFKVPGMQRERQILLILKRTAWERQGKMCMYCHVPLILKEATADHITPVSKGGKIERGNICAACKTCNNAKGAMDAEEFLKTRLTFV